MACRGNGKDIGNLNAGRHRSCGFRAGNEARAVRGFQWVLATAHCGLIIPGRRPQFLAEMERVLLVLLGIGLFFLTKSADLLPPWMRDRLNFE